MGNGHSHSDGNMRRVILALILTACFMVVEVIGGLTQKVGGAGG